MRCFKVPILTTNEFIIGFISVLLVFVLSYFLTKFWIKIANKSRLVGKDMNKIKKNIVPEGGGIAVILSIVMGILFLIFIKVFFWKTGTHMIEIFSILITVLLAFIIGFADDVMGWKNGLKQWQKPLLTLPIALPLVVTNAGTSFSIIPFLGSFNLGIL